MAVNITLEEIKVYLPFSEKIPYGFDKPVRAECTKQLGQAFYGFNKHRWGFFLNRGAGWYVKNMTLYVRNEKDLGIITLAVLNKQANK